MLLIIIGVVIFVDHCIAFAVLRTCIRTCLLNMHTFLITVILSEFGIYFNLQMISGL